MLTEQFLNLCGTCLLNEKIQIPELEDSILDILKFYESGTKGIPVVFKNKFDLIKNVAEAKKEGKSRDIVLDSIISTSKYKDLEEFLNVCSKKNLTEDQVEEAVKQFTLRRKFIIMLENYSGLTNFIETFENNMFDDLQKTMDNFEDVISNMYGKMNEIKRQENTNRSEELDLLSDDYGSVLKQIKKNYSGVGSVPSGYTLFDKYLKGGFQPKRVYIFGGSSGDGKSTLLINLLANALKKKNFDEDVLNVYLYVTLENHIDESLVRLYCCCNGIKEEDLMKRWEDECPKIGPYFKDLQKKNNNLVKLIYFPASDGSIEDIITEVENLKAKYRGKKKIKIKMIYADYLDLMKSGKKFDLYRLELGQVTTELKLLSVIMECPVASPTQLNRAGYNKGVRKDLTMVTESIKKVENADFIGLVTFIPDEEQEQEYDVKQNSNANDKYIFQEDKGTFAIDIAKHRNGVKNKVVYLRGEFSKYLITDTSVEGAGIQKFLEKQQEVREEIEGAIL